MTLKIPPCPVRATDGSNWPRHKAKARNKKHARSRVLAALNAERSATDDLRICQ